jgi:hypothetical protein
MPSSSFKYDWERTGTFNSKYFASFAVGVVVAVGVASFVTFQPARADVIYSFDTFTGSGTPPPGPYGSVKLHQNGADVDVTVMLLAGEGFVNTGADAA